MIKLGQTREFKECICEKPDGKCFERLERITSEGRKSLVWAVHCKELDKISKLAAGVIDNAIMGR